MVKISCILIDDEAPARAALKHEISIFCPDLNIIGEAANVNDAIVVIKEKKPDLVFLDIQLTDGVGFDHVNVGNQALFIDLDHQFNPAFNAFPLKAAERANQKIAEFIRTHLKNA